MALLVAEPVAELAARPVAELVIDLAAVLDPSPLGPHPASRRVEVDPEQVRAIAGPMAGAAVPQRHPEQTPKESSPTKEQWTTAELRNLLRLHF